MLDAGLEVEAAFEKVEDVAGENLDERLAAGYVLRNKDCRVFAFRLPHGTKFKAYCFSDIYV